MQARSSCGGRVGLWRMAAYLAANSGSVRSSYFLSFEIYDKLKWLWGHNGGLTTRLVNLLAFPTLKCVAYLWKISFLFCHHPHFPHCYCRLAGKETVPLWKSQEGWHADLLVWFPFSDPEQHPFPMWCCVRKAPPVLVSFVRAGRSPQGLCFFPFLPLTDVLFQRNHVFDSPRLAPREDEGQEKIRKPGFVHFPSV